MTDPAVRTAHLKDTTDLYGDIANGTLQAVSFVKPNGWVDGHPASSKVNLFEGFVKKIVDAVQANPSLFESTAIFITFDEGGGYYDSGYIQALNFFGDGTRIPMIVVSCFSTGGHISHVYSDHVSILKFIELNRSIAPVTSRSRDNLPNPLTSAGNSYVPNNRPAIGDLTDLFNFSPAPCISRKGAWLWPEPRLLSSSPQSSWTQNVGADRQVLSAFAAHSLKLVAKNAELRSRSFNAESPEFIGARQN